MNTTTRRSALVGGLGALAASALAAVGVRAETANITMDAEHQAVITDEGIFPLYTSQEVWDLLHMMSRQEGAHYRVWQAWRNLDALRPVPESGPKRDAYEAGVLRATRLEDEWLALPNPIDIVLDRWDAI